MRPVCLGCGKDMRRAKAGRAPFVPLRDRKDGILVEQNAYIATFERIEKKYLLTHAQFCAVRARLEPHFTQDAYGVHTIHSVYYDTEDFALVRASLAKPRYKEKLRLRSYGTPEGESRVYLEIKKKYEGIVYKRRAGLTLNQARAFNAWGVLPKAQSADAQIFAEIGWMRTRYALRPRAVLSCERVALFGCENAQLRVTFDANMRFRTTALDLAAQDTGALLRPNLYLMEIKVPGALPVWLARILCEEDVWPVSFSKYGTAYRERIEPAAAIARAARAIEGAVCEEAWAARA